MTATKMTRSAALDLLGDLIPDSHRPTPKPRKKWVPLSTTLLYTIDTCACGLTHRRPCPLILCEEACFIGERELIRQTTADPIFITAPDGAAFDLSTLPIREQELSGTTLAFCSTCAPYLLLLGGQPFADQAARLRAEAAGDKRAAALRASILSTANIDNETTEEIFYRAQPVKKETNL